MQYTLGFLGAGNMAQAIAQAAIDSGALKPSQMIAADPTEARRQVFANMGIAVTTDNKEVIGQSAQVMLAVKPQMMKLVASDLAACGSSEQIVQSIMAGITIEKLNGAIAAAGGQPMRIVRIMPNTPMMIGFGMAGIATSPTGRAGDDDLAMKLFSAGGKAIRVAEPLIDSITAVSGSGPAYVFYLAQAMEQAASDLGLTEHARLLVGQTLLGAAQLLLQSSDSPAELRRKVTSPGGTTEAAIKHMDANQVMQTLTDAVKAAERRSKELGK